MNERFSRESRAAASAGYFTGYLLSTGPVLGLCCLLCPYSQPTALLSLYFVEWTLTVWAYYALCPWLRHQGVTIAASLFLICFAVAALTVRDYRIAFNAPWSWSDDWRYVLDAELVAKALCSSGWDLIGSWNEYAEGVMHWSLAGWPFLLGLVSSLFVEDGSPLEAYHAVALSLNALFLTMTLAIMFHVIGEPAKRFPWQLLLCFLLLAGSPLVYAGESRKESMLQLIVMAVVMAGTKDIRKGLLHPAILLAVATLALLVTRPTYLVMPVAVVCLWTFKSWRIDPINAIVAGVVVLVAVYPFLDSLEIRDMSFRVWAATGIVEGLQANPGLGTAIYNVPYVGPFIFYLLAPLPINPYDVAEATPTIIIVSVGSVCYVLAFAYVAYRLVERRLALWQGLFPIAALMSLIVFLGAVIASNDPRYKQPSNFCLAIMLFLTWADAIQPTLRSRFAGVRPLLAGISRKTTTLPIGCAEKCKA